VELVLIGRQPHRFSWDRAQALNALVARRVIRPGRTEVLHAFRAGSRRWREQLVRVSDADLSRTAFRSQSLSPFSARISRHAKTFTPRRIAFGS
jgi:hypothetical protein